ncbi:MAG TPA: 4-hydroxythreonine-4-phosphate dehydrogenase PdxA [Steroidobacteraceae bacterium]|nr:4-hydroxythreonine-4-phosphate dehydrogenase PdxA [Steroidobacteraceae bacterium]
MNTKRIVITTGEPAGVGPDLALAAALSDWPCQLVFAGDPDLLAARAALLSLDVRISPWHGETAVVPHRAGTMPLFARALAKPAVTGKPDPANARYVLALLDAAMEGCLDGRFAAMVTAPVQKSSINDAGIGFSGHTEHLAARSGAPRPVMLLVAGSLRVALATTHLPLADVPRHVTRESLGETLDVLDQGLAAAFALHRPRILVCGLNPHAGEGGHLGREEQEVIGPAVAAARARGIEASGPVPADTAFAPASLAATDAVLAMFHDQGLPVVKHAGFGRAVNLTLGLPFWRTSVDHGTALDLAGSGRADPGSLFEAIELAQRLG